MSGDLAETAVLVLLPLIAMTTALAVVGAILANHTWRRRAAPYQSRPDLAPLTHPWAAAIVHVRDVLARPSLWPMGLLYALALMVGRDPIEELAEEDVREIVQQRDDVEPT